MAIKTPFFEAFGPLLFGRAPRRAVEELGRIDSLEQLYGLFGDLIPRKLLAGTEKGVNSRNRCLPPRVTFWAFVAQVLSPGSSCRETVRKVEAWWRWAQKDRSGSLRVSAYCQARARLDKAVLALIAGQISWTLERNTLRAEHWLKGREVKIVDGLRAWGTAPALARRAASPRLPGSSARRKNGNARAAAAVKALAASGEVRAYGTFACFAGSNSRLRLEGLGFR